ncbi:MAG: hypothetical protein M0Z81_14900 [Deltaproteobacteria bacterium]|jgi:cell division protein FtsB|nr:hypothetical protein [Deltaproteobacteria bacterium]
MDAQQQLFGLVAIAKEHQKAVQAAIDGLTAEHAALARERAALAQAGHDIQQNAGDAVAGAVRQSLAGVSKMAVAAFEKAAEPFRRDVEGIAAKAGEAAERVNSAARWINIKAAVFALIFAVVCIVVIGLAVRISVAWEEHRVSVLTEQAGELDAQIENLKVQIAQERSTVAYLDKRGGRVHWGACGGRLCFQASSNQGTNNDGTPVQIGGWVNDKGKGKWRSVIPRGY